MDTRNTLKAFLIKSLDWLIFILLGLVSIFFMVDCFQKFANESTYFEVSSKEKQHVESPTLTFCFGPGYKQDVMDKYNLTILSLYSSTDQKRNINKTISELYNDVTYRIGSDFYITIKEQRIGNFNFTEVGTQRFSLEDNATINLTLDSILTGNGICHRLLCWVEYHKHRI